eukprot:TRINITY_DN70376_c0_g1_i1.p1 TRINITY_DN70376_c0_g1~~TRINITY_DN70376_c0_g1_i1.p1  ORF type:complete len:502 (+),score=172.23 TRINITY_DN70376_c0_g1_i1:102-1508(+)
MAHTGSRSDPGELQRRMELAAQLTVCGMSTRQVKTLTAVRVFAPGRRDVDGVYEMLDDFVNERPCWGRGHRRLYCGAGHLWIFGDEEDVAAQRGRVRSAERGKESPLECHSWQQADGMGGWEPLPDRLKIELAHGVDINIQSREMVCPETGEKLCLYDEQEQKLICHVTALKNASQGHTLCSIDEFMRKASEELQEIRRRLCDKREDCQKAKVFLTKLQGQRFEYDKMKQQVQGSIEAAIEYLRQEEQKELARIDRMRERNELVVWEKLSEIEACLQDLNMHIDNADETLDESHPPLFHQRYREFIHSERDEIPIPSIESQKYENYAPQIHNLPLHRVVPPVGSTVRIPQSTLLLTEGQTDVGNVCFMGVFFELHLKHNSNHMGVFLHCPVCDPVYVTMEWALDICDLNREPLITTKVADGKFPKDSAIGWQNAISLDILRRHPAVELSVELRNISYDLQPPVPMHTR